MSLDRSTKKLAQNTGFVLVAELVVQLTRAATIFVLAELFPKDDLGVYAALLALTTLLAPVSQWGMNHVGVRAIARNVPFTDVWAKVSSTIFFGGLIGTTVAVGIAWLIYDVQLWIVVAFGIAQLIGFNTAQAATMMSEAHHRSDVGLRINIVGGIVRLTALASFFFLGFDRLSQWALFLVTGMTFWGATSALQVAKAFNGTHRATKLTREDIRLGVGFTFVQTSASGQTDIDKIVLEANDLTSDTANYAPGYRIAEMTTIPLIAIVRATYSEFFRRGESTIREAMAFSKRLTAIASAYGIVAGLCLFFLAPLVHIVIDESKLTEVVDVVRWIAFIPFVKGLQYFPGNVLSGSDHHNLRSVIIFITAAVNLVGNLIFIPRYGWQAAATTTAVSEFLFAGLLWTAVITLARREDRQLTG